MCDDDDEFEDDAGRIVSAEDIGAEIGDVGKIEDFEST